MGNCNVCVRADDIENQSTYRQNNKKKAGERRPNPFSEGRDPVAGSDPSTQGRDSAQSPDSDRRQVHTWARIGTGRVRDHLSLYGTARPKEALAASPYPKGSSEQR
ncbi:hypothetical protein M0R45_023170 [Rubus argutus]|uniref:Uncharacterized protein n=1 Tax=Rubus argutus TaxID=59490 RepID=A0AAW1WLW2_RUBAR